MVKGVFIPRQLREQEIQKQYSSPTKNKNLFPWNPKGWFPHFTKRAPKAKDICPNEIHLCEGYETNQSTNACNFLFIFPVFIGEIIYVHICGCLGMRWEADGSMRTSNLGRVNQKKGWGGGERWRFKWRKHAWSNSLQVSMLWNMTFQDFF